jgi:hypothetical protein
MTAVPLKAMDLFPVVKTHSGIEVAISHFVKNVGLTWVHDHSFDDFDRNSSEYWIEASRDYWARPLCACSQTFVVDDMIAAIDSDITGVVDPGEEYLLP